MIEGCFRRGLVVALDSTMSRYTRKEVDLNKILISQNLDSLVIPKEYDKSINIKLNLSLPLPELEAYIKKLKKNFDIDKGIIKTPLELLRTELQEADNSKLPKKPNKKMWADTFFIYDYVETRLRQIEYENALIRQEYEKDINTIKQSKIYDSFDKKIQLARLAKEHNENLINTGMKDIFNESELLKGIDGSSGTASSRYYLVKPYIEESKYKELIAGSSII